MLIVQSLIIDYIIFSHTRGRAEEVLAIFHIFTEIRSCSGGNLCSQFARTFSSRCNLPEPLLSVFQPFLPETTSADMLMTPNFTWQVKVHIFDFFFFFLLVDRKTANGPSRSSRSRCCPTGATRITPACTASEYTEHLQPREDDADTLLNTEVAECACWLTVTNSQFVMEKQNLQDLLFQSWEMGVVTFLWKWVTLTDASFSCWYFYVVFTVLKGLCVLTRLQCVNMVLSRKCLVENSLLWLKMHQN